jgi:hypothetical protein
MRDRIVIEAETQVDRQPLQRLPFVPANQATEFCWIAEREAGPK